MTRLLAFLILCCVGVGGCAGPAEAQPSTVEQLTQERLKRQEDATIMLTNAIGDLATDFKAREIADLTAEIATLRDTVDKLVTNQESLTKQLDQNRAEAREDAIESRQINNGTAASITAGGGVSIAAVIGSLLYGRKLGKDQMGNEPVTGAADE
jgi:TolA-binding protein